MNELTVVSTGGVGSAYEITIGGQVIRARRQHECPSCDLSDAESAEVQGYNRGVEAALRAVLAAMTPEAVTA